MWRFAVCLVALVITGDASAQSHRPSPSSGEQRQAKPNPTQQNPAANQQAPAQPPIAVNVLPSPKTEAERAEEAGERQEKADLDRRLVNFTADLAAYTARLYYATLAVAIATICLVLATAGLAIFGFVQSRDMKASVAVADRAAKAAELSAQASIGVQLPRLVARNMQLYEPSQPYSSYRPFGRLIVVGDPQEWSQVSVQIRNIGKTTAVLTEECIDYFVGPRLPKTPEYTLILPSPVDRAIEADGSMDLQITNYFIHLTAEQRRAMKTIELSHRLWVYGFIRYTDFLDKPHEYRFCRRCTWTGGIGGSIGFVTESDFPAEYTRSY
jgi:hypothetical protein